MQPAFHHIDTWIFDLDNTLYPSSARLFDQINIKMTDYVMELTGLSQPEADKLRADYYHQHGTTMAGLMASHDLDTDDYLYRVHDIDVSHLTQVPELAKLIAKLPGRKIIHTNGSKGHAENVTRARAIRDAFDEVYGVEDTGFIPKPKQGAFDILYPKIGLTPDTAAFFEDEARNLAVPHSMGMRTIWVDGKTDPPAFVDHKTNDLTDFLSRLVAIHFPD